MVGKKNREAEFVDIAPLGAINDSDSGDEKRIFRSHPGEDHDDYEVCSPTSSSYCAPLLSSHHPLGSGEY
jgi:hypothetical protein